MVYLVSVVMDNSAYTTIKATREEAERYADEVREKAHVVTITLSD
jgi:hypothetical protein